MYIPELYSIDGLALIVGYLYTIISGIFLIPIMKLMRQIIGDDVPKHEWQPILTGCLERILYVSSLLAGYGEFIGFWLGYKVLKGWPREQKSDDKGKDNYFHRYRYSNNFTGNGLSILYAFVGFLIIIWIDADYIKKATIVAATLLVLNIILLFLLKLILHYKNN
jgi:hypothetical protein